MDRGKLASVFVSDVTSTLILFGFDHSGLGCFRYYLSALMARHERLGVQLVHKKKNIISIVAVFGAFVTHKVFHNLPKSPKCQTNPPPPALSHLHDLIQMSHRMSHATHYFFKFDLNLEPLLPPLPLLSTL